ncbi:MAG: hypothetical protein QF583_08375 [Rhodospirillales bacterium]|nr:hypothetical protein [Rhodospirillales bacterium]
MSVHTLSDLWDSFQDSVEAYSMWEDGTVEPAVDINGQEVPISKVCGLVWHLTDIMPGSLCQEIQYLLPWPECDFNPVYEGSTYAKGARHLKRLIKAIPLP